MTLLIVNAALAAGVIIAVLSLLSWAITSARADQTPAMNHVPARAPRTHGSQLHAAHPG